MTSDPIPQATLPDAGLGRKHLVLQIEDNIANARLVMELIERRLDLSLQTAKDGPQGIEMAIRLRPAVILLDMKLPGMSGLDVIPILGLNTVTARIPVIALSSNAYPIEIRRCMDAGIFRYLTKPFKLDVLLDTIDEAIQCTRGRCP